MSIAEIATNAKITDKAARAANILILDIERIKGRVVHEFWDLSEMKGRRFRHQEVTEWPRIISVAAIWYDKPKRPIFHAEWDDGGRRGMVEAAWLLFDQADIVVGHNMAGFDEKHLKGEWAELGLPKPRPWRTVDTLRVARSEFRMESNTLGALCQRLGVAGKDGHYDHDVATLALAGDKAAQKRLREYNVQDCHATLALYDRLRPWMRNHPHMGLHVGDERACPACGGDEFTEIADTSTDQTIYAAKRCANCGNVVRNSFMRMRATTRLAR